MPRPFSGGLRGRGILAAWVACAVACGASGGSGVSPVAGDAGRGETGRDDATTGPPDSAGDALADRLAPADGVAHDQGGPSGDATNEGGIGCGDACAPDLVDVLTYHYDNLRTGANLRETILTTSNTASLHEIYRAPVDGEIYAQPLYANGVAVEGGTRSLLFVATMEDTVYAFDGNDGAPVWRSHLGTPAYSQRNVGGNNGILSTPVIDRSTETMYVVVRDCDPAQPTSAPSCAQRLFALDIRDGSTLRSVAISGQTNADGGAVTFNANAQWNRPGLLLEGGHVYVAFAAGPNGGQHEEDFDFRGWVFGYAADHFDSPPSVFCSTPNGHGGGIWQSGCGLASDGTSIYFVTGNAIIGSTTHPPSTFPPQPAGYEDSVVQVTHPADPTPIVAAYHDDRTYHSDGNVFQYMEANDVDLGASGPVLLPGTTQLIASGKSGIVYNIDRATMRAAQPPLSVFTNPPLASGQTLYIYSYDGGPAIHGSPAFWKPDVPAGGAEVGLLFAWPENDRLQGLRYDYASHLISTTSFITARNPITNEGGMVALSANGGQAGTGLLWASSTSHSGTQGHLWAFDASNLAIVWETDTPHYAKFVPPVVANGKVFIANSAPNTSDTKSVIAFGL